MNKYLNMRFLIFATEKDVWKIGVKRYGSSEEVTDLKPGLLKSWFEASLCVM